jgi:hypothetical protein
MALFALLFSLYLLVYSGSIESGDSRFLLNATASLVRFGDFKLDLSAAYRLPPAVDPADPYPLVSFDTEPGQPLLAAPLYLLANFVPHIGLVHTTWLFNALVTALTGCLLYVYGYALGYSGRAALLMALAFGVTTIAVAYSKTFFREPLTALFLLATALAAERARASGYHPLRLLVLATLLAALVLTRASALLAIPAVLVLTSPPNPLSKWRGGGRRGLLALLLIALLVIGVVVLAALLGGDRYNLLTRIASINAYTWTALHSYLISPGGSIWATSPVLLLLLPGMVMLWRRGERRYALALPLALLAVAGGYALTSGVHWFGGLSFPPRFLVFLVPLLMLGTLPVFEALLRSRAWGVRTGVLLLCLAGLWVQVTAVSLRWSEYLRALPPEANGTLEWGGGLNTLQYLRPVLIPQLWGQASWDLAWMRAGLPVWWVGCAVIAVAAAVGLWWGRDAQRRVRQRRVHTNASTSSPSTAPANPKSKGASDIQLRALRISILLAGVSILWAFVCLRLLYDTDYEFRAADPALHALLDEVRTQTERGDVVLLSNLAYVDFFLNYGTFGNDDARIISLPLNPGDRPSPEEAARVSDDNPDALVEMHALRLIHALAGTRRDLWLVENTGPALAWSVRPIERFLAAHYYPISTTETGAQARLIRFSTAAAPDPFAFYAPVRTSDLRFANGMTLAGYDLPHGTTYAAGAALPVSLYWTTDAPLERDYTIGLYLRAADGAPITQSDMQPGWGFAPTSSWRAGLPVWDHRALLLPPDLPAGRYLLWLKVYGFDENFAPVDVRVTAGEQVDESIGVLAEIEIVMR